MFNAKKRYFKKMLRDVEKTLWELEFSKFRAINVREGLRRQHDQAKEALNRIDAVIKAEPKNEQAAKDRPEAEARFSQVKAQIDDMDARIFGVVPSEAYPEGVVGMTQKIDNLIETRSYLHTFIKSHC